MYAYKIVVTTLIVAFLAICAHIAYKNENRESVITSVALGVLMIAAIGAIWL